ncbi:MAG: hypothetical protein MPW17_11765 [Candidatus Manganitrophus sp.]|nr:hypothetical protein [Candidatus Manganitrophus sp.]MDC4223171.1 hypothetical protein [Candidatus Manganitrophus sp.]WDT69464.1 MAG: hypothetical protein MPW17_11765 [Candidatus Manganitrophus sp.]
MRRKTTLVFLFILFVSIPFALQPISPRPAYSQANPHASPEELWTHFTLFSIVRALAIEGDVLWVGTSNGLLRYDLVREEQKSYTTKNGLLSNIIHTVAIDPKGNKWIGTYGGGLSKFDGKQWTTYTPYGSGSTASYGEASWTRFGSGKGLGDLWVYGVHFDPKGTMWVATWKGVSRFDGTFFQTYTTDDGLIDKWVYTLAQDQKGTFWFGTEGGSAGSTARVGRAGPTRKGSAQRSPG